MSKGLNTEVLIALEDINHDIQHLIFQDHYLSLCPSKGLNNEVLIALEDLNHEIQHPILQDHYLCPRV